MVVVSLARVWLLLSWCGRWLCRLDMMFWFLLSWCVVYLCLDDSDE